MIYTSIEHARRLTPDYIRSLRPNDLLSLVVEIDDVSVLRHIAKIKFATDARMENEDNDAPFIRWPAMNQRLEPWLPVLLAKVTGMELCLKGRENLVIIAAPSSATPYIDYIKQHQVFPNAQYPLVLKAHQFQQFGILQGDVPHIAVPSYVHGRNPLTGARGNQEVFFFEPGIYQGATVVFLDDALAEGLTVATTGAFVRSALQASQFWVGVSMAKAVQHGVDFLLGNSQIDGLSILIHVTKTHGKGKPIEFN